MFIILFIDEFNLQFPFTGAAGATWSGRSLLLWFILPYTHTYKAPAIVHTKLKPFYNYTRVQLTLQISCTSWFTFLHRS